MLGHSRLSSLATIRASSYRCSLSPRRPCEAITQIRATGSPPTLLGLKCSTRASQLPARIETRYSRLGSASRECLSLFPDRVLLIAAELLLFRANHSCQPHAPLRRPDLFLQVGGTRVPPSGTPVNLPGPPWRLPNLLKWQVSGRAAALEIGVSPPSLMKRPGIVPTPYVIQVGTSEVSPSWRDMPGGLLPASKKARDNARGSLATAQHRPRLPPSRRFVLCVLGA